LEVLIPLAPQRVSGRLDVEGSLGDHFGLLGGKRRGLCLQDCFGFGSGSRPGLAVGGHGFNLRSG
jgi:hypothetical protein